MVTPDTSNRQMPQRSAPSANRGLLIVGHGTRDPRGAAEFLSVVRSVAEACPGMVVEPCFLELAEPSIAEAVATIADRGARHLTVVPLVLFAAGHAKRDIPRAVAEAAGRYADFKVQQAGHLGCHGLIVELSLLRFQEALASLPAVSDSETLLLMVGRGSRDPDANSEMCRFSRLVWERRPTGWLETCFTALTEPTLERAIPLAASLPFRRIVVLPHLLFQGELLDRVVAATRLAGRKHPDREWIVASHLGPHELLVQAIVQIGAAIP